MIDKEKFRKEVEKLKSQLLRGACSSQIAMETRCKEEAYNEVLSILDTMQEEPVSIWHGMSKEAENGRNIIIIDHKDFYGAVLRKGGSQLRNHNKERYVKWAYIDDIIKLSNVERTTKNLKEEPVTEDLGEYIDKLSKQFPEVSFAKLSRIAVRVAKWKNEQMMAKAIDVEVKVDAGGYPYIPQMELYDYDKDIPLAKEGDRYKVILIKES